jgi:SAM-dependent methyltransferase
LRDLRTSLAGALLISSDNVRGPLDALAARMPSLPILQFDLVQCPLPADSLDAVILLNVLEHIEAHEAALGQVFRILKPGGIAVIEVPAGPHLYDVYDKVLLHWRRYTLAGMRKLAESVGFHTLKASHLGFFVYPAFAWAKKSGQRMLASSPEEQRAWVNQKIRGTKSNPLLGVLMRLELALGRWLHYGIGIRCLLTCRKPG